MLKKKAHLVRHEAATLANDEIIKADLEVESKNKFDDLETQIEKPVSVTMTKKTASCRHLGRAIALGKYGNFHRAI